MTMPENNKKSIVSHFVPPFVMAILFAVLVGLVCRHGAQVSGWDSLCYLAFAQTGTALDLPLHHGIGYSVILRFFFLFSKDIHCATASCAITVAFLYALLLSASFRRLFGPIGFLGAGANLLNFAILENFGRTMSEALFILLVAAGHIALLSYLRSKHYRTFFLSALALAGACLTRYAGLAFVASATLLICHGGRWSRQSFLKGMSHAAFCLLPLLLVMGWNHIARGTATNRVFLFHPPRLAEFSDAGAMLGSWFCPDRIWISFPGINWVLLIAAIVLLCTACIRAFASDRFPVACWTFPIAVYALFLLAAFSFFDSNISYDRRMLSPVVFFVIGGLCLFARRTSPAMKHVVVWLLVYLCVFGAWRVCKFTKDRFIHGSGYFGDAWNQSDLVKRLECEVSNRVVYSNVEMGFHARGVPDVRGIVCTRAASSWQAIAGWEKEYAQMLEALQGGGILGVVWLESKEWCEEYVPLQQIVLDAGLERLAEYPEGTIWGRSELKPEFTQFISGVANPIL